LLRPVLNSLNDLLSQDIGFVENVPDCLDRLYYDIVNILVTCAKNFVPVCRKCFYKFWWDEELDTLKEAALESDKLWKAVGKPRSGPLFNNRQRACLLYRQRIREGKRSEDLIYMNELNDALIKKNGPAFWKCWKSKFEHSNKCLEVDGCVDADIVANKFVEYFATCYSCYNISQSETLRNEYTTMREKYCGFPCCDVSFDVELVSKIIFDLK